MKTFVDIASASSFLPRLQLFTSNSTACKSGKFPINHYGLVRGKDQIEDLGTEIYCLPMSYRYKAMNTTSDPIITVFDPHSELFIDLKAKADIPDSGCVYGVEFLVWLADRETFATLYLASKSARQEAQNVLALLNKPMKLGSKFIEKKKFSWQAPVAFSSPLEITPPPINEALEAGQRFLSEKPSEVQMAPTDDARVR